jgi:hypothetical protein
MLPLLELIHLVVIHDVHGEFSLERVPLLRLFHVFAAALLPRPRRVPHSLDSLGVAAQVYSFGKQTLKPVFHFITQWLSHKTRRRFQALWVN